MQILGYYQRSEYCWSALLYMGVRSCQDFNPKHKCFLIILHSCEHQRWKPAYIQCAATPSYLVQPYKGLTCPTSSWKLSKIVLMFLKSLFSSELLTAVLSSASYLKLNLKVQRLPASKAFLYKMHLQGLWWQTAICHSCESLRVSWKVRSLLSRCWKHEVLSDACMCQQAPNGCLEKSVCTQLSGECSLCHFHQKVLRLEKGAGVK